MFGFLKKNVTEAASKFSGKKDYLEAVCAAVALIATADGELEDSEVKGATRALNANKAISEGFGQKAIEQTMQVMLDRAGGGRVGRNALWSEIEEVLKDAEMASIIVLTALDVCESDGEIEPKELEVLQRLATLAKVDLKKMMQV